VFGSWQIGSTFFHFVVEYNVVYNNALANCATPSNPIDTDGNGIIFDTNLADGGNTENYPNQSLVAFNIVYNNGGGGIHIFDSAHVTVANNSCYNNQLDPANGGTNRACMDESSGFDTHFINNIAVAVPVVTTNCSVSPPYAKFNFAMLGNPSGTPLDTFSNNLTDMIGVGCNPEIMMNGGDVYNAPPNIESTNPGWVNVGTSSVGTETTPPIGTNFALQPGSKAIGAGLAEPYLPAQSVDVGACSSALTSCP
jgi:parallel beta-helix repeat protein